MNVLLRIYRSSAFLSIISVFDRLLPLVLLPFLTQYLDTTNYGLLYTVLVVISFVVPLLTIGFNTYQQKEYYKSNTEERRSLMGTYLVFQICVLLVLVALSYPLSLVISSFKVENFGFAVLAIVFSTSVFQSVYDVLLGYFRVSYSFGIVGANSIIKLLLEIGLTIVLVQFISNSWESRVEAILLTNIVLAAVGVSILLKRGELTFVFDRSMFKKWMKFGSPLIIHRLSSIVFNMSDRILITMLIGASATGIYTVGYQLASVVGIIASAISSGWSPWFYKIYNSDRFDQKMVNRYMVYIMLGIVMLYLATIFLGPYAFEYFLRSDVFKEGFDYIPIIGLAYVFQSLYFLFVPYLIVRNRSKIIGGISFLSAFLNFGLNILLLQRFGPMVAAYTTLLSWVIQSILVVFYSNRIAKRDVEIIKEA